MEYSQAKKIIEELKTKVTEQEKHAIELLEKELKETQEGLTVLYMKGAFDKNQDWRNKIEKKKKSLYTEGKIKLKKLAGTDRYLTQLEYEHKESVLEELLKEEYK